MKIVSRFGWLAAGLILCAVPMQAIAAGDTQAVPKNVPVDPPGAPARIVAPQGAAIVRIYRDSIPWFGENRDVASFVSLGKVVDSDLFIHPLSDLASGIPAGTRLVLISSNGEGNHAASVTESSPAAQKSLKAFVRRGGVLIVDMGDNDDAGGFLAPGTVSTPRLIFPDPCEDATFAPAAKGKDGVLGTADDHPIVKGPDGVIGTADDLNDSNLDMIDNCSIAHGNLSNDFTAPNARKFKLPKNAIILLNATFDGRQKPILAQYRLGKGLVIVDTVTKEFEGQNPQGVGPSLFMRSLFAFALAYH